MSVAVDFPESAQPMIEHQADSAARLFAELDPTGAPVSLAEHRITYRPPQDSARHASAIIREVEAAGLRGRGGASFPTAVKMRAVAGTTSPVVVVNGTEGEPASRKDRMLLGAAPHLVLDGALLAAIAVGASEVHLCIARTCRRELDIMRRALAERQGRESLPAVSIVATPDHYVVGEETALLAWLGGAEARPTGRGQRPTERGLQGRPTLVDNVETVAHLAQIHRFGADRFRSLGTAAEPGTLLCTITRADGSRRVVEAGAGMPIASIVTAGGASLDNTDGVLVGGYFGSWLTTAEAAALPFSNEALAPFGASVGCGVIAPIPAGACGWCETARVLAWMAGESAGQCGVCVNGLGAIARVAGQIAWGGAPADAVAWLHRWAGQVDGRGACRFPDGAVRLLRTGLRVHAASIDRHLSFHGCPDRAASFLPVPDQRSLPWR